MKSRRIPNHDLENLMPYLIGIWRKYTKLQGPKDRLQTREFRSVVDAVSKGLNGEPVSEKDWISAHLLYHWVIHYQEGLQLLGELPKVPHKVIDLCSGAIPFGFAALKHGASEVIAIDKNETYLRLGSEICGRYGYPVKTIQGDILKNPKLIQEKVDLIILAHSLDDLDVQYPWIFQLMDHLNPSGHLLIVDKSYPKANQCLLHIREELIKKGVAVLAPCVNRGICPVLDNMKSPCYAQREFYKPYLIKEIQRGASINLSSLKMSYMIFRATWPTLSDESLFRIISPPVESYHGKAFYLCGKQGRAKLSSRLKEHPKESKAFDYLRRGELISISQAFENDEEFVITEDTQIQIKAACSKPLFEEHE